MEQEIKYKQLSFDNGLNATYKQKVWFLFWGWAFVTESYHACPIWVHWLVMPLMWDFARNGGRNLLVHVPALPWATTSTPGDLFLVRACCTTDDAI